MNRKPKYPVWTSSDEPREVIKFPYVPKHMAFDFDMDKAFLDGKHLIAEDKPYSYRCTRKCGGYYPADKKHKCK